MSWSPRDAPLPEPLLEEPPPGRFCDLVLTGGVASGVVYPWAILELARKFRFRNLGGTSVGAMAAALAAAAEYGRRRGHKNAFEVLRQTPIELAEEVAPGRTRMLSLFQPSAAGRRLFELFVEALNVSYRNDAERSASGQGTRPDDDLTRDAKALPVATRLWRIALKVLDLYRIRTLTVAMLVMGSLGLVCLLVGWLLFGCAGLGVCGANVHAVAGRLLLLASVLSAFAVVLLLIAACRLAFGLVGDFLFGVVRNDLGLCRGKSVPDDQGQSTPALVEWLNEGIQRAAGLPEHGPPLTFEELWRAPLSPGGPVPRVAADGTVEFKSLNLEMFTTNVTHGRPYRLPMLDQESRLFFDKDEWAEFFPAHVMNALMRDSLPYHPRTISDPADPINGAGKYELPGAKLPIVVAARLSLSFPLLFSAVPLWAVDMEMRRDATVNSRQLKKCRFSDGGLSSNFPVHFFDAALPRWPTFGVWLQRRSKYWLDQAVWLPPGPNDGRGDIWQRFERDGEADAPPNATTGSRGWLWSAFARWCGRRPDASAAGGDSWPQLTGFLVSAGIAAKDWGDLTAMRLPHVRRRVARMGLLHAEGALNIAMSSRRIMHMAVTYGVDAGRQFCARYAPPDVGQQPTVVWREHLATRVSLLVGGLTEWLDGFGDAAAARDHTLPAREASDPADPRLAELIGVIERVEKELVAQRPPGKPPQDTELRLRSPL